MSDEQPYTLGVLRVVQKEGSETLHLSGQPMGIRLLDFWRWSASDLISNTMRGVFAEFLVANALGVAKTARVEWAPYDLVTENGTSIEVKASVYIQSWYQSRLSRIQFSIRPASKWGASTNQFSPEKLRSADLYVFCVLSHRDQSTLDPLDLNQWDFYVLPTSILNQAFPTQKSIGLASLLLLNPCHARYEDLKECIESLSPQPNK
jgi:hypothetical protein